MDKSIFINAMTILIQKDRIDDCAKLMKRLWIRISIHDAKTIAKAAYKYNTTDGELPFPKEIGGVAYQSAGEYVYSKLNDEQKKAIEDSDIPNIKIE